MLKHTPKNQVSKPPHYRQHLVDVKKDGRSIKSNKPGKIKLDSIASNGELPPFLYFSQVYLRSLPNQLMDQQYHLCECTSGL